MRYRLNVLGLLTLVLLPVLAGAYLWYSYHRPIWQTWKNDQGWKLVYLASPPRSGNHWTRYLIEEATGISTGAIFRDLEPMHLEEPFAWGGYAPAGGYEGNREMPSLRSPVVLKTHYPFNNYRKHPGQFPHIEGTPTVLLVRNPYDCIFSCYVYLQEKFGSTMEWNRFLELYIQQWSQLIEYWEQEPNVAVFYYEKLLDDPGGELRQMIRHIGFSVSDEDIQRAVKRYPAVGRPGKHLSHFSEEDRSVVERIAGSCMKRHGYS